MKVRGGSSVTCDSAVALLAMSASEASAQSSALRVISEQLREAVDASKCHRCGCLQQTVEALAQTEAGKADLVGWTLGV